MNTYKRDFILSEEATIKALLMGYPEALAVLLSRGVPVTCANGTIAEAARASGVAAAVLMTDLADVVAQYSPEGDQMLRES